MDRKIWWVILVLVWVGIGAAVYFRWQQGKEVAQAPQPAQAEAQQAPAPQPEPEPAVRYPIASAEQQAQGGEQPAGEAALPSLAASDKAVRDALASFVAPDALEKFVITKDVVRHFVATVDNLPRKKSVPQLWPVNPTAGQFVATGKNDDIHLGAENGRRYEPFVRLAESVDTAKLVALYVRFYPLFQQAYAELGYPKQYFNDRLVDVIDHLLATPDVAGPIKLTRPRLMDEFANRRVLYEFADADLEARSTGQKILMRIGSANAARVKAKLQEIRRQVTGGAAKQ